HGGNSDAGGKALGENGARYPDFPGKISERPGSLRILVQQAYRSPYVWIAKRRQPTRGGFGQILHVAADHFDEDQFAELREHAAAADPLVPTFLDRRPDQTSEPAGIGGVTARHVHDSGQRL